MAPVIHSDWLPGSHGWCSAFLPMLGWGTCCGLALCLVKSSVAALAMTSSLGLTDHDEIPNRFISRESHCFNPIWTLVMRKETPIINVLVDSNFCSGSLHYHTGSKRNRLRLRLLARDYTWTPFLLWAQAVSVSIDWKIVAFWVYNRHIFERIPSMTSVLKSTV